IKYYFDEVNAERSSGPYTHMISANNFAYVKVIHGTKTNNINYCEDYFRSLIMTMGNCILIHSTHRRHGSIIFKEMSIKLIKNMLYNNFIYVLVIRDG
ncbi:hypothetical protein ACJX0J_007683, partial [Zea mays]